MFWSGENCEGVDLTFQLVRPPEHGEVAERTSRQRLSSRQLKISPTARCEGHVLPISMVYYRSGPGFRGMDRFTVRWTNRASGEVREKTYTINVW